MRKFIYLLIYMLSVTSLLTSCHEDEPIDSHNPEIVVEGWIADGGYPIVFVTSTIPITSDDTSVDSLANFVARWARVSVTVDGQTTFLTGMYDPDYFPPYVFTTTGVKGKAGKTYHLSVDWRGQHAEATTTVLAPVPIDEIWTEPCNESDTLRQIGIRFQDPAETQDHYLLFYRLAEDPLNPSLSMLGTIDDAVLNSHEVTLYARQSNAMFKDDYIAYYPIGSYVQISLARVDDVCFQFWRSLQDNKLLSGSPIFNISSIARGNVRGGHGIWYGCGLSQCQIVVE